MHFGALQYFIFINLTQIPAILFFYENVYDGLNIKKIKLSFVHFYVSWQVSIWVFNQICIFTRVNMTI